MKLGPALVMTPDIEAALTFYRDVLGLRLERTSPDQLVFDAGAVPLHVLRCEHPAPGQRHGVEAATVITFEVESLETEIARLRGLGVAFLHATPADNAVAGVRYAAFAAPGGNVHELVERTPATAIAPSAARPSS